MLVFQAMDGGSGLDGTLPSSSGDAVASDDNFSGHAAAADLNLPAAKSETTDFLVPSS